MENLRKGLAVVLCVIIGCAMIFISGCAGGSAVTINPAIGTKHEVKIDTGRKDITVSLEIYEPKNLQTVRGIILMFGGTGGSIKPSNFHVREIDRFVELGYIAVLQDKPSNFWNQPFEFRWSKEHQTDITKVISYLKDRYNNKSLFLLGYSEGVWSPAPYHLFHPSNTSDVSGIILMGGIYLNTIQSGQINLFVKMPYPVLIVKHEDDRAPDGGGSGFISNEQYYKMLKAKDRKGLFIVKGGTPAGSSSLNPFGPHGFGGKEKEVVKAVVEWMDGTNGMDAKEVNRIIK